MRSSRLFRRVVAGLCAAAMLCGGMAASAAAPALPAAPAAVEATNAAPSDAELKAAFSKFTVTYDEEAGGWDLSSPQEQASMDKKSCGLYPYMFLQDDSIAFNMILTYVGSKKLDIKTVNVSADDELYTFTCDEEYGGGYDQDLGCWFDLELFHQTRKIRTYFRLEKGSDFSFSSGTTMKAPVDGAKLRCLVIGRKPITRFGGYDYEVRRKSL